MGVVWRKSCNMRVLIFSTLLVLHSLTISALGNEEESVALEGEHCQYIDFANARSSGSGCVDGTKMVIKKKAGLRKQFLIADSRTIYGFVEKGGNFPKKFATNC